MRLMRSWKTPTPEQVSGAVAQLIHAEHYRYFFDRLENPLWIEPLAKRGYFKNPPAPLRDEVKGTVSHPRWPDSRFLARMAALPEAQETVATIALQIPGTENTTVHEDLADLALALPPAMAAKFARK